MAQPTKPGNIERGWNDPPMFLHSVGPPKNVVTPTKKSSLTKRVAYPGMTVSSTGLSDGLPAATSSPPEPGSLPPPCGNVVLHPPSHNIALPKAPVPIIVPAMSPTASSPPQALFTPGSIPETCPATNSSGDASDGDIAVPEFEDDEQFFHYVTTGLLKAWSMCQCSVSARAYEDVLKKLKIFEDMWRQGMLSYHVKLCMAKLSTALHKRQYDAAHQLHLGLMMDYISEVGQWMVGIKRLISEARNTQDPKDFIEETAVDPKESISTEDLSNKDTTNSTVQKEVSGDVQTNNTVIGAEGETVTTCGLTVLDDTSVVSGSSSEITSQEVNLKDRNENAANVTERTQ